MVFLLIIALVLFVASIYVMFRNERVYKFRMLLLNAVSNAATRDLNEGRDWEWRFEEYRKVSYAKHVYSFKSLRASNFYSDLAFVDNEDVIL